MTARDGVGIVDGRAAATAASLSRRSFTRLATAGIPGFFAAHGQGAPATEGLADRLNLAVVGIGGRGAANLAAVSRHNIVALCDVDDRRVGKAYEEHPRARRFADFRRMFDSLERQIDGVVISTPDHTHFHTAWWALERGKHVYLEKPLAHEVEEVRRLTEAARRRGLATQQGMQRHATPGLRAGVEIVKAGLIGEVREVHSWVNSTRGLPEPKPEPLPVPAGLDWDLWLGPLPPRPYAQGFAPYDWRFWWEFGSGEAGNWGCHILDIPFWALELGHPTHVTASGPAPDPSRTPREFASTLQFPARQAADGRTLPAVTLHWSQGPTPALAARGIDAVTAKDRNTLFVGSAGMLVCGFQGWTLLPETAFADVKQAPRSLPPTPGFYQEWIDACRGGPPATCDFSATGPLTEAVLLANVAYRVQGGFDWDAVAMKSSRDDVNGMLRRTYRRGWEA
jgi:predicted dehydrogenase